MKKAIIMSVVGLLAIVLSSCGHSTDGTTGATGKKTAKLPNKRRFDVYQVVGIVPGIKKFVVKYNDDLIRGGTPYSDEGFQQLKKMGIKTIVSITPTDAERELAKEHKMNLIEIPFPNRSPLSEDVKRNFINLFYQYETPFFMHADENTSRAGILGALYRMKLCDWPYGKTMMEFQQLGGDMNQDRIMINSIRK